MKKLLLLTLSSLVICGIAGCKKSAPVSPPASTPAQVRLAPEGVLYVVKPFSTTTVNGVYGFPAGKKVALIRIEKDKYRVTDGRTEGVAPKQSFTNDLNIVDALVADNQKKNPSPANGKK